MMVKGRKPEGIDNEPRQQKQKRRRDEFIGRGRFFRVELKRERKNNEQEQR
jgi:hypothetical protein